MAKSFDVVVVGLGAMGASVCYHLARRGASVLGLEQFDVLHAKGSSHGGLRMIRLLYGEHPDYVPLLWRAYDLWRQLEAESGERVLHITGGIYMGAAGNESLSRALASAREHRLPHRVLERPEIAAQYSQFVLPERYQGIYDANAGFLLAEKAVGTHVTLALRYGAEVHGHEPVIGWEASAGGVEVRTSKATYHAGEVVFCGGPWSGRLVHDLGVELVVTRQVLGWVWPRRHASFQLGRLPVWVIYHGDGTSHYGFPMMVDRPGFKLSHHWRGPRAEPDALAREPAPGDEEDLHDLLQQFIPEADGPLLSLGICMYTNSPDGHFVVDRLPSHPHVTVACGFSGHGFKFAPVIGESLADFALLGKTALPVGFLGLHRFAG